MIELLPDLPKEEGYYWYYNKEDLNDTPCVVKVLKHKGGFYAMNEEFMFYISIVDGELWGKIPNPCIDGKEVKYA